MIQLALIIWILTMLINTTTTEGATGTTVANKMADIGIETPHATMAITPEENISVTQTSRDEEIIQTTLNGTTSRNS